MQKKVDFLVFQINGVTVAASELYFNSVEEKTMVKDEINFPLQDINEEAYNFLMKSNLPFSYKETPKVNLRMFDIFVDDILCNVGNLSIFIKTVEVEL